MKTTRFDESLQCEIVTYTNIHEASMALAKQLHNTAVRNIEAIDSDWNLPGYSNLLKNEAKAILEEKGRGDDPCDGNPIIEYVKES